MVIGARWPTIAMSKKVSAVAGFFGITFGPTIAMSKKVSREEGKEMSSRLGSSFISLVFTFLLIAMLGAEKCSRSKPWTLLGQFAQKLRAPRFQLPRRFP